jgi:hypothetical protein
VGIGVAEISICGLGVASLLLVDTGVLVDGTAEGKGVIGMVAEGVFVKANVEIGCTTGEESLAQPEAKITNKVNMTFLDEINGINRPFVIRREYVLVLEYRPKIIVYWTSFGNNLE